jgi:hypothetical protein
MNRATVAEQVLGSMPLKIARSVRRLLTIPARQTFLTPAQLAVVVSAGQAPLDHGSTQLLALVLARVGAATCTVHLGPAPIDPSDAEERARHLLCGDSNPPPIESADGFAEAWLGVEKAWREGGDVRNAVMARACALLSSLPASRPTCNGVATLDLGIGAAGAYALPPTTQTAVRRAVRDNLALAS